MDTGFEMASLFQFATKGMGCLGSMLHFVSHLHLDTPFPLWPFSVREAQLKKWQGLPFFVKGVTEENQF